MEYYQESFVGTTHVRTSAVLHWWVGDLWECAVAFQILEKGGAEDKE